MSSKPELESPDDIAEAYIQAALGERAERLNFGVKTRKCQNRPIRENKLVEPPIEGSKLDLFALPAPFSDRWCPAQR